MKGLESVQFMDLLTYVVGAAVAFVWHTLNATITAQVKRVEEMAMSEVKTLDDRFSRFEVQINSLPGQLDALKQQLQRIELQLASTHVTKAELKEVNEARSARMDRIESMLEDLLQDTVTPRKRVRPRS